MMVAHVPGAKPAEISGRRFARVMMNDMMHVAVPPVADHHSHRQAVRDVEGGEPPQRQQNDAEPYRDADPRGRSNEIQWRAVMQTMHGREHRHAMQGDPVQHIFQEGPQDQPGHARAEPTPAAVPGKMVEIDRRQRAHHDGINHEIGVIAEFAELHRCPSLLWNELFDHEPGQMLAEEYASRTVFWPAALGRLFNYAKNPGYCRRGLLRYGARRQPAALIA